MQLQGCNSNLQPFVVPGICCSCSKRQWRCGHAARANWTGPAERGVKRNKGCKPEQSLGTENKAVDKGVVSHACGSLMAERAGACPLTGAQRLASSLTPGLTVGTGVAKGIFSTPHRASWLYHFSPVNLNCSRNGAQFEREFCCSFLRRFVIKR